MRRAHDRRYEILDAIVRLHVETGQPVGSILVARALRGDLSPATIRAVMVRLEAEGWLAQPHASAGRVPTDEGYRSFLDRYLAARPLLDDAPPREVLRRVEARLQRHAGTQAIGQVLASLLSELTAGVSIILGPSWESARALRLDLYPREGRRILMVLVFENALVRSGVFTTERDYPAPVVAQAARLLSERVSGRTVAEIRTRALPNLDAGVSPADRCATELAAGGGELFVDLEEGEIALDGLGRLLEQPEFSDPGRLKSLIRFLESPRQMRDTLQRLDGGGHGGIAVWIGDENPVGELRPFSLLSAPFSVGGRRGILAVLGLRRMPYPRAVAGMDVVLNTLRRIA